MTPHTQQAARESDATSASAGKQLTAQVEAEDDGKYTYNAKGEKVPVAWTCGECGQQMYSAKAAKCANPKCRCPKGTGTWVDVVKNAPAPKGYDSFVASHAKLFEKQGIAATEPTKLNAPPVAEDLFKDTDAMDLDVPAAADPPAVLAPSPRAQLEHEIAQLRTLNLDGGDEHWMLKAALAKLAALPTESVTSTLVDSAQLQKALADAITRKKKVAATFTADIQALQKQQETITNKIKDLENKLTFTNQYDEPNSDMIDPMNQVPDSYREEMVPKKVEKRAGVTWADKNKRQPLAT